MSSGCSTVRGLQTHCYTPEILLLLLVKLELDFRNPLAMLCWKSYVETYIDWKSFYSQFEDFLGNLPLKIITDCVADLQSIS